MRFLSRVFRGILLTATLVFAGVSPSFAIDPREECLANGFYWVENQCCWLYYRDEKDELVCINGDNWDKFEGLKDCDPAAGYIDSEGTPHCCPEGTEPNSETHRCECKDGGFLDPRTGKCLLLYAKISNFCEFWNNHFKVGYFLNYLLGGSNGGLQNYKSKYTCEEVIDAIPNNEGGNLLVWNERACRCSCKNPVLTFNPGAADACADGDTAQCDNICVDLMDDNNPCPMGQQSYYVDGKWQCCIFYDPDSGKCIETDAEWRQYVTEILGFESGGGYIGPDGLPIECPVGKQEDSDFFVTVYRSTGRCICLNDNNNGTTSFGFFDTTTGTCKDQYQLNTEYGVIDPSTVSSYPGVLYTNSNWGNVINLQVITPQDAITDVGPNMASNSGFLDTFLHTVFDTNGTYDYTDAPLSSMLNANYIATDLYSYGHTVTARRLAKITFSGNGGTPVSQSKRMFVVDGTYSDMPVTPTRPGYNFAYWYNTANPTGGTQFDPFAMQGDATYYARWTPHTYKIRFNNTGCGGTTGGSMADQNMTYGTPANLNTNGFTCTGGNGYLFQGWATSSGGNVVYQPGAQVNNLTTTQNGTYNLYAVWVADNPTNITVTLDLNGSASGSCSAGAHTISYGNSYTLPSWDSSSCNITNGVKVFVGWTETAPSSSNNYLDSGSVMVTPGGFPLYNLTTNKTYYAVWRTPTCGGSNVASATPVTASYNFPKCDFTCESGYGTSGVKTGANAGDTSVTYNCENSCYQMTLDSTTNGGSGGPASIYMYYNSEDGSDKHCKVYSDSGCTNEIQHLPSYPTKTNATFASYYNSTGSIAHYDDDDFWEIKYGCNHINYSGFFYPKNKTFVARYACNEGYCAGCEINGNYISNMISGACNAASTTTVSFNSTTNGGTGGPTGTVTATYGVAMPDINSNPAVTLAAPTPPSLHRFSGFYNSASGSTGYYGSANPLQSGARWDKTNSTYTLYAKYERCGGVLNYSTLTNSGYSTYNDKSGYISTEPGGNNYSSYNILTYSAAGFSVPSGSPAPTFDHWQCSLSGYGSCNGSLANVTSTNLCGSFNPGTTSSADFTRLLDDALCRGTVCMNACWKYNITYDLNDTTAVPATHATNASAHPNDYTNCDGATIGGTAAADKPTRTGYDFAGWCTSDVGTTCYTNGSCCSMTQTINVDDTGHKNYYAKWSQNSVSCNAGYYLPANSTSSSDCAQCRAGNYCLGGAFSLGASTAQGEFSCPARQQDDLGNSTVAVTSDAGSSAVTQCYIHWLPDNCAEYINNVDYGGGINITTAQYSEHVRVYAQNDGTNNQDAYPTASRYIVPAKLYSLPGYEVDGDNSYNGNNNYVDVSNYPPNTSGYKGLYAIVGKSCTACTGNKYARGGGQLKWMAAGNVVMNGYGKCNSCVNGYTITGNEATDHDNSNDCKVTCGPGRAVQTANAACTAVGVTHWAPGGTVSQGSTSGNVGTCGQITGIDGIQKQLQTTGSGVGANEAGDCGLALHIGTDILRLRSSKKTTPSLNFNYSGNNGADLFLNLSTNASPMTSTRNFKMNYGGTLYYGCDDTTCVEDE
ncbi:MAG: InlB B-repeat-containing protein [Alphaproteobacteria bacterium]|nr:InlB B-repeat-containing protein [Alphaproteobacteria bacterium]